MDYYERPTLVKSLHYFVFIYLFHSDVIHMRHFVISSTLQSKLEESCEKKTNIHVNINYPYK